MFWLRNKKNNFPLQTLVSRPVICVKVSETKVDNVNPDYTASSEFTLFAQVLSVQIFRVNIVYRQKV